MKQNVAEAITQLIREREGWLFGGTIEDTVRDRTGHKASTVSRVLRDLSTSLDNKPKLLKRYVKVNGKGAPVVQYALNPDVYGGGDNQLPML